MNLFLVELQLLFFSTEMFEHSKHLFSLDFQDSSSPSTPYAFNINVISSCQTLLKAFEISKKQFEFYELLIVTNWAIHESFEKKSRLGRYKRSII